MRCLARGLARAEYCVRVPQLAGNCDGSNDLKVTHCMDWFRGVKMARRSLRQRCDTVVVGGLCMGNFLRSRYTIPPSINMTYWRSLNMGHRCGSMVGAPLVCKPLQSHRTKMVGRFRCFHKAGGLGCQGWRA